MSEKAEYRVKLTLGDYSGDGHGKTEDLFVLSNLTGKQIKKAYKKGIKQVGFDFSELVCREFEDSSIPKEDLETLKGLGYVLRNFDGTEFELEEYGDGYTLDHETFADIYMFIAKLGNPNLEYRFVEEDDENVIWIGGYGMFNL